MRKTYYDINGKSMYLTEIAHYFDVSLGALSAARHNGRSIQEALEDLLAYKAGRPLLYRASRPWKPQGKSLRERFLHHFATIIPNENGCKIWPLSKNGADMPGVVRYGRIIDDNHKARSAHIVSFEIFVGPTGGLCVCHRCDVPMCVEPQHLWLGTHYDNSLDKIQKGRAVYRTGPKESIRKIHFEQESDIKEMYAKGLLQREIAEVFGVSQGTIHNVLKDKRAVNP